MRRVNSTRKRKQPKQSKQPKIIEYCTQAFLANRYYLTWFPLTPQVALIWPVDGFEVYRERREKVGYTFVEKKRKVAMADINPSDSRAWGRNAKRVASKNAEA